ncbi:MAG: amino acid ABC transporter substrate-binding protein [Desulfamplus sp.]|nr:amino acid ABC transporter substrate-binding protein [Desulfamplus sp.]
MKIQIIKIPFAVMTLAIFSSIFIFFSCTKEEPPVSIGAALALSGPAAYVGEEVRDGLLLATDEINQQGGINGRKIEIMVRNAVATNSSESEKVAKEVFDELDKAQPLVIVSSLSFLSMKLAPIAEAKQRLLVGLVATVPELTKNREWVYRYWTTAEHEALPMTNIFLEISKNQNLKKEGEINKESSPSKYGVEIEPKIGIIYIDDPYGSSVFKDINNRAKEKNISVVQSPFPSGSKDFSNNVDAVKDTNAVLVIGFDVHIIAILKALRAINYKGDIISTTTATLPSVTSIPESNGIHVTAPALYNKNYPFADEVKRRYEERYKKPFTQYSANGYDFIRIFIGLLEDKPMDRDSVKAIFDKGFVYSGVFGNVELKRGSKDILFPLFPAQIKNGEIIYR